MRVVNMLSIDRRRQAERGAACKHAEAYVRMEYSSAGGRQIEYIWNSRDGVTPHEARKVARRAVSRDWDGPYGGQLKERFGS